MYKLFFLRVKKNKKKKNRYFFFPIKPQMDKIIQQLSEDPKTAGFTIGTTYNNGKWLVFTYSPLNADLNGLTSTGDTRSVAELGLLEKLMNVSKLVPVQEFCATTNYVLLLNQKCESMRHPVPKIKYTLVDNTHKHCPKWKAEFVLDGWRVVSDVFGNKKDAHNHAAFVYLN